MSGVAAPPIILMNSEKTHSNVSTFSSRTITPASIMLWKWLFTPANRPNDMSYRLVLYVQRWQHLQRNVLESTVPFSPHQIVDPPLFVSLNPIWELLIFWTKFLKHLHCFPNIILGLSRLILPRRFSRALFVKGTFSILPKKLPIMLYTSGRFTLFCRSCFTKSLLYTSICLCEEGQCIVCPKVGDSEWLCSSLCSAMYHSYAKVLWEQGIRNGRILCSLLFASPVK